MEACSGINRSSLADEKVDFLSVCEGIAHDIEEVVNRGSLLNERQCRELSSKLLQTVENIRVIIEFVQRGLFGSSESAFTPLLQILYPLLENFAPFLQILYKSLEKAKLLVLECAEEDWTAVVVFQVQNESSFQEILLEVFTCCNSIYDTVITIKPCTRGNLLMEKFHDWISSLPVPILVSAIESDREDLRRRLELLASDSSRVKVFGYFLRKQEAQKQCLARHVLKKFSCTAQECLSNSSHVCKAALWKKEIEPLGTWGNSNFLGSGSGASGVCRTQWLGVPCAKKVFHGQASEVTFLKEASILSHLKHPRIVNFICCGNGEGKGNRFIAMELMEKSLFDVIEERKGVLFALPVAVDIIVQIVEGMCYLHEQGIAHRDLKPHNVVVNRLATTHLVDEYYCVKLVDFGLSKTKVEVSKSNTISFGGIGTTRYRAPEVHPKAQLNKVKWFKVDVYSFAMTCAHVLALKAPFEDLEQLSELYEHLLKGERPQLPSGLPWELVLILRECWDENLLWRPSFKDIYKRLLLLRSKVLGGIVESDPFPTKVHKPVALGGIVESDPFPIKVHKPFAKKGSWAKRNGKGMDNSSALPLSSFPAASWTKKSNSRMSNSVSTGQTSYCTAFTHLS